MPIASNKITYICLVHGLLAPGIVCGHVIVGNKHLCGYRGEDYCEFRREKCESKTREEVDTSSVSNAY
jgi:hypothetical protein